MRTIAIINLKGGTAKTTTTVNLAAELRHRGKRVLCIDADPQHNLTDFLGASADGTTHHRPFGRARLQADIAVQRLGAGFGCVPSDLSLCEIDIEAIQKGISLRTVRDLCEAVADDFDVCLIDCPPSFTAASIAALVAADEVLLPVTVDAFAIGGAQEIVQQVENLATVNPALRVRGVLVTMWQHTSVCMQGEDAVRRLDLPVLHTVIRRSCKVQEATFARQPLRQYAPRAAAALDYESLCCELLADWGSAVAKKFNLAALSAGDGGGVQFGHAAHHDDPHHRAAAERRQLLRHIQF